MTNQLQKQKKAPVYISLVESMTSELAKLIPAERELTFFQREIMTYFAMSEPLMEALQTERGIITGRLAVMKAAQALTPDGRNAHFIAYRNKKGGFDINYQIDYKGYVKLMIDSGKVKKVFSDVVCENDDFEWSFGEVTRHIIDFKRPRGKVILYYSAAVLTNGETQCEKMTVENVNAIRQRSKSPNAGPWVTDFEEMAKKSVIRKMSKLMDVSPKFEAAVKFDNEEYQIVNVTPKRSRFERAAIDQEAPAFLTDANAELDQAAEEQDNAEQV